MQRSREIESAGPHTHTTIPLRQSTHLIIPQILNWLSQSAKGKYNSEMFGVRQRADREKKQNEKKINEKLRIYAKISKLGIARSAILLGIVHLSLVIFVASQSLLALPIAQRQRGRERVEEITKFITHTYTYIYACIYLSRVRVLATSRFTFGSAVLLFLFPLFKLHSSNYVH